MKNNIYIERKQDTEDERLMNKQINIYGRLCSE